MSVSTSSAPTISEPQTGASLAELALPAFFVSAAALIIAVIDPIYTAYEPRLLPTLLLNVIAIALVWFAVVRRSRALFAGFSAILFGLVALEASTQPASLETPVILIWPFRIMIFAVVVTCWALFMRPPVWLRRAVLGVFIPTALILTAIVGPSLGAFLFQWQTATLSSSFPPYWLALDSSGTLYASGLRGGLIEVFDPSGSPIGTLRPAAAPEPPTPGPGILPNGMEEEIVKSGLGTMPTPTVTIPGGVEAEALLDFCGIAVDPHDDFYAISMLDSVSYKITKFDRNGSILAKIPLPESVVPGDGCLAVDADHLYVNSITGQVFVMDYQGNVQLEGQVSFQITHMTPAAAGKLIVISPRELAMLDVNTGAVVEKKLPIDVPPYFTAVAVERNGNILISDSNNNQILRLDPAAERIIGTIGGPGKQPGQFGGINGLAIDRQDRIYVADYKYRVIQRFSSDGKIDAVWWASNTEMENDANERR